jgi:hypothetical protein
MDKAGLMEIYVQNNYFIKDVDRSGELTYGRIDIEDGMKELPAEQLLRALNEQVDQLLKDLKPMIMMRILEELVIRRRPNE